MSKKSKARRDARKKKQPKARRRSVTTNNKSAEPHAALLGDGGVVLGGAAFHSGEWILLLNGEVVSGTNSAAMILAMLKHTASVRESEGMTVKLTYSTTLKGIGPRTTRCHQLTNVLNPSAATDAAAMSRRLDPWLSAAA